MRVVICEHPGPPGVLRVVERPIPEPGPREVLVAVAYAAITFVETQVRAGIVPMNADDGSTFPLVLGNGVAGTVVKVGTGVDPRWIGEKVVTSTAGAGGYAEYAVAPMELLHRIPAGLDAKQAVALLADGRTALALARAARLRPSDRVLITAAAGGVGSLLVQLARAAGGSTVIGLAGGAKKLELARSLGADAAIDYRRPGWERDVRDATNGLGVDVAFDGVGGIVGKTIVDLMEKGGRYLPHGMASGAFCEIPPKRAQELDIIPLRSVLAGPNESYDLVEQALTLAATGQLRPVIGQVFPLERAAEAHAAIEARKTLGKTLLVLSTGASFAGARDHRRNACEDEIDTAFKVSRRLRGGG